MTETPPHDSLVVAARKLVIALYLEGPKFKAACKARKPAQARLLAGEYDVDDAVEELIELLPRIPKGIRDVFKDHPRKPRAK